jgi:3-hydroxybutyryl-CoA dehydrogenase
MVRRIMIPAYGDVNVLQLREEPPRALGPGDVRIRVAAAGVNFADLLMRMGLYPEAPRRPFTPGYEVSGRVVEMSPEAQASRPDLHLESAVFAVTRFGGYTEEIVVPAHAVFPIPEGWSFEEAAAFPVVTLTAWMALVEMARVRSGDRVLVHSIAGGVGLAALEIARAHDARVFGTASGEAKANVARERGAEQVVDPGQASLAQALKAWAPHGVDVILEPRGWRGVRESLGLLAPGGRIVAFGVSEMAARRKRQVIRVLGSFLYVPSLNILTLLRHNAGLYGLNLLTLWDRPEILERTMQSLLSEVKAGRYRPRVAATFPLSAAAEAHRFLHDRKNIGKVVLTTGALDAAPPEGQTHMQEQIPLMETRGEAEPTRMERVVVIGAGTMGHGIAHVAALAGIDTTLVDVHPDALERGLSAIRKDLALGVEKGKVAAGARDAALGRLRSSLHLETAVRDATVVIEAVPEDLALKQNIFAQIDRHAPQHALLATNTSALPVSAIAGATARPEHVVGMHFFNPVHLMDLLEIVRGEATGESALERAKDLGRRLGKECIVVKDTPGFATSRLGVVLGLEAMRMLEEGVAAAEDIDKAMTLGYRHPIGPLRLTDLVGLDVRLAIAEHLYRALGRECFQPPQVLRTRVAEGKLGKKTGEGFYRWAEARKQGSRSPKLLPIKEKALFAPQQVALWREPNPIRPDPVCLFSTPRRFCSSSSNTAWTASLPWTCKASSWSGTRLWSVSSGNPRPPSWDSRSSRCWRF